MKIKKILNLLDKKSRKKIVLLLYGMILMGLLEVLSIASIAPFMGIVVDPGIITSNNYLNLIYGYFGFQDHNDFLVATGLVVLFLMVGSNLFFAYMNWNLTFFSKIQGYKLAQQLLEKYLSQPYSYFINENSSDLSKNILSELPRIINGIIIPLMTIASKAIVSIFVLVFLIIVNTTLALSAIIFLGAMYWSIYKLVRSHLNNIGIKSKKSISDKFRIINEAFSGIKEVKIGGYETEYLKRFSSPSMNDAIYSAQSTVISMVPRYAIEVIAFGGLVATVIYFILISGNDGTSIIPLIAVFALAMYRLLPALQQIYAGIATIQYNLPALDSLISEFNLTNQFPLIDEADGDKEIQFESFISLEKISFSYKSIKSNAINNLNLRIKHNTTIGIAGSTGSGKTTLINILLGLYMVDSGKFLVDGIQIDESNVKFWQKKIGYVPQEIYLADDSIENNIAFGINKNDINEEKIIAAAKLADIDNFISALPMKYKTFVGERGVKLSGGQRQRIGIARALYHNPTMIVLDEATSALDGITENEVMKAIDNISLKKTIIIVAHRITTLKKCDQIYLINNGEIESNGSYSELMRSSKKFQKMAK